MPRISRTTPRLARSEEGFRAYLARYVLKRRARAAG